MPTPDVVETNLTTIHPFLELNAINTADAVIQASLQGLDKDLYLLCKGKLSLSDCNLN